METANPPAAPVGAQRLVQTAAYFAAFVALGMIVSTLGPTLPGLASQTGSSLSQVSLLFTARAFGALSGSFTGGRLYDHLPGHRVLVSVLLIMASVLALVPAVPTLWLMVALMVLLGLAEGLLDVGSNILMVWVHGQRVGPFMNALHFFFGVGAFLAPILVAQVLLRGSDIGLAYRLLALILLPLILWLLTVASPRPAAARESEENDGPIQKLPIVLIAVLFFLYVGAEVSYGGWIFTYALTLELGTETAAAYLTSAFWGALTVGRLLGVPFSSRFRPSRLLLSALSLSLASVAAVEFWPNPEVGVWLGSFGLGLGMAAVFPTLLVLAGRRLALTGRITGWFYASASAGAMLLPGLMGRLFERFGPWALPWAVLISLMILLAVLILFLSVSERSVA